MADRQLPSIDLLRQLLRYEPDTGKLFWKERSVGLFQSGRNTAQHNARKWNTKFAGKEAFTAISHGYHVGKFAQKTLRAHRVAFAIYHGVWPFYIDHINGVTTDNRIENLRDVTQSTNLKNAAKNSRNSSGANGVSWHRETSMWRAQIRSNGEQIHLGLFKDFDAAVAARKEADRKYGFTDRHGE